MSYLIIWIAMVLMFERAMYCGYVVDDDSRFVRMRDLKSRNYFKPIQWKMIPFFIWESMYGAGLFRNAKQDHLANLIIHGINCSLIYRMTNSLPIALLYMINPINNQTVLWLNGRRYSISIMAVLLAWNFWPVAPLMIAFCAWLHVSGIMLPFLFLCTPFWWTVPIGAGIAALVGHKKLKDRFNARKSDFTKDNPSQKLIWKKSILYVKTIGYQFFNCLLPNKPAMYHDFLMYYGATEAGNKDAYAFNFDFWKGAAVLVFLAFDHSFYALWFILFISQWCNILQVTMPASDRYCSLPNIGVMALLVKYAMLTPYGYHILIGFGVFYFVKYQPLFLAYRNVENFHLYHIAINPATVNSRFFLSKIYIAKKDPYQAFGIIRQGMRYRPYDFKLMLGFIECLFALGKKKAALQAMDLCEKHIPFGEEEETAELFKSIRDQFKETYNELRGLTPDGHRKIHNNGKPYVKRTLKRGL